MKISAITRRGLGKQTSDDRILIGSRILCEEEFCGEQELPCAVGVADGVGGNAGGDIAAQFVCERLSEFVPDADNTAEINADLLALSRRTPGRERMAATFSGVFPQRGGQPGKLLHIGNTRICAIQGGYLKQLTEDMTSYNYYMALGRTEEAERCSRSEITACFGGGTRSLFKPYIADLTFAGGALLITSDGVHDFVDTDALEQIISSAASDIAACRDIVAMALRSGSEDDISVLIART